MDILQDQTSGDAALTVLTSDAGGGLKDAVDAMGVEYEAITRLVVTSGSLNLSDCRFINQSLPKLKALEIGGTADFEQSTVPANAFKGNQALTSVKLANTTAISESAFEECSYLVKADLPEVTVMGGRIFYNCYELSAAELPKLAYMENRAFYRCTSLTSLLLGAEPPELIGSYWFKEIITLKVFVPSEPSIQKYKDIYEFSDFKIKVVGDDSGDSEHESSRRSYYDYKYDEGLTYRYDGPYYTGDYKIGLNLYSLSLNLNAWLKNSTEGAPPIDTMQAIRFAKEAGFDAVDVTAYYHSRL